MTSSIVGLGSLAILAISASCLSGCFTALGTVVGSSVVRWDTVPPNDRASVAVNTTYSDEVEIEIRRGAPGTRMANEDATIRGKALGVDDDEIIMQNSAGESHVALRDVTAMRVKNGTYWYVGTLIGIPLDVVLVVLAVHAASQCCAPNLNLNWH